MERRLSGRSCSSKTVSSLSALIFGSLVALAGPGNAGEPDWGGIPGPTAAMPRAIGGYALGCLDGGMALTLDGPGYHVMRPSRARNYGHPDLIRFVRWLGGEATAQGWPGILVGDLAQARGGPMRSGHASHQSGLDVDVWFRPAPYRPPSLEERETTSAVSMVAPDGLTVGEDWGIAHADLLRTAASHPQVDRIFVNAAIKRNLCETAGSDRSWLAKIRPWWGHDHHFHVRLKCPRGERSCTGQAPPPPGDGCGAELAWWLSDEARKALVDQKKQPRKVITMSDLPQECASVYGAAPAALPASGVPAANLSNPGRSALGHFDATPLR